MKIETLRKKPLWELKVMVKALSQPVSSFLNTDEDNERLENCKKIIKERQFLKLTILSPLHILFNLIKFF